MFGWKQYLSERDKEHDKLWGKKEARGFGEKPALLLIDIYYSVLGLKREPIFESMKTWPMSTGLEGWAAVDRCAELVAAARAADIPVIHVKGLHSGINPWFAGKVPRRPASKMSAEMAAQGNEIVDEVKPIPGELVVGKEAASAFWGTPLVFQLISLGVDTLICAGETTSGCVRATVVDGATNRFKMGVVAECCFDRTEASHCINLYDMHQKYADVVHLEAAIEYFHRIGGAHKTAVRAAG